MTRASFDRDVEQGRAFYYCAVLLTRLKAAGAV